MREMENKRVAIVRVRGDIGVAKKISDTLKMLRLFRRNSCIIIPNSPAYYGMLKRVKDFVTWGEINEKTFKKLLEKRGKLPTKKPLTEQYLKEKLNMNTDQFVEAFFAFKKELKDIPGLKLFFKLKPPQAGFERKGIKKPFSMGGALGYRKDKINELIERMV